MPSDFLSMNKGQEGIVSMLKCFQRQFSGAGLIILKFKVLLSRIKWCCTLNKIRRLSFESWNQLQDYKLSHRTLKRNCSNIKIGRGETERRLNRMSLKFKKEQVLVRNLMDLLTASSNKFPVLFFPEDFEEGEGEGEGRRVFLLVLSLFPILSNQEGSHTIPF